MSMIDVVPVVRCKDCKWLYDGMDYCRCRNLRGLVRICKNSFCSYGERKKDKSAWSGIKSLLPNMKKAH